METMAYFPLKEKLPSLTVTNFPGGRGPLLVLLQLVGVGVDAYTRRAQKATCPRRDKNMGDAGHGVKTKIGRHLYI